jgi:hypothetical protein
MFGPAALPDLLSEFLVSDEANKRAVSGQVVRRTGDGIVRGIATTEIDAVPRHRAEHRPADPDTHLPDLPQKWRPISPIR